MNVNDLRDYVSVTNSRLGTIARALFGDVPVDFTDVQVERVEAVVTFMRDNQERSVKRAIQRMASPSEVHESDRIGSSASSTTNVNSLHEELGAAANTLANDYVDRLEAEVLRLVILRFGSAAGPKAQAMREQLSQNLQPQDSLPQTLEGNDQGFLPSSTSMPLLSASQAG